MCALSVHSLTRHTSVAPVVPPTAMSLNQPFDLALQDGGLYVSELSVDGFTLVAVSPDLVTSVQPGEQSHRVLRLFCHYC
jgi:hypothetical protein